MPLFLVTVFLVLGALGLLLVMPGRPLSFGRMGAVLLAGAAAALVGELAPRAPGGPTWGCFVVLALVGLGAAIRVITHQKPVYSALYFVLLVVCMGGLLVLLDAEFLAAALLLIYAGAILVTYVFVIMLAQQSSVAPYDAQAREPFWGVLGGFVILAVLTGRVFGTASAGTSTAPAAISSGALPLGTLLLTHYVIGLQIAGVLLLAAMVGAIAIAQRKLTDRPGEGTE